MVAKLNHFIQKKILFVFACSIKWSRVVDNWITGHILQISDHVQKQDGCQHHQRTGKAVQFSDDFGSHLVY
jgi:hypothetical protein